jgi:hypothetical protein
VFNLEGDEESVSSDDDGEENIPPPRADGTGNGGDETGDGGDGNLDVDADVNFDGGGDGERENSAFASDSSPPLDDPAKVLPPPLEKKQYSVMNGNGDEVDEFGFMTPRPPARRKRKSSALDVPRTKAERERDDELVREAVRKKRAREAKAQEEKAKKVDDEQFHDQSGVRTMAFLLDKMEDMDRRMKKKDDREEENIQRISRSYRQQDSMLEKMQQMDKEKREVDEQLVEAQHCILLLKDDVRQLQYASYYSESSGLTDVNVVCVHCGGRYLKLRVCVCVVRMIRCRNRIFDKMWHFGIRNLLNPIRKLLKLMLLWMRKFVCRNQMMLLLKKNCLCGFLFLVFFF